MTNWEIVTALVDSLAWPAAIVVILTVFRQEIRDRIGHVVRVRAGDREIEFGELLDDAAREAEEAAAVYEQRVEQLEMDAQRTKGGADSDREVGLLKGLKEAEAARAKLEEDLEYLRHLEAALGYQYRNARDQGYDPSVVDDLERRWHRAHDQIDRCVVRIFEVDETFKEIQRMLGRIQARHPMSS